MHWWHTPPFNGGTGMVHPCKLHYIYEEISGGEESCWDTHGLQEGSLTIRLFRNLRQLFEIETAKSVWIFHLNPEFLHASQLVDVFSKAFMSLCSALQSPQMPHCWPMLRRSPPSPPLMPLLSKGPRKQGQMWLRFSVVAGIVAMVGIAEGIK